MKVLLDTHILWWIVTGDARLSAKAKKIFTDVQCKLFFSIVGFWELAVKSSLKKANLHKHWYTLIQDHLRDNSISVLPITPEHCHQVSLLPFHHRDPFDRLLIAQAITEDLTLLTADPKFKKYNVDVAI
jgi:PIN domain nuclease of toxin-antitoxin system